MIQSASSKKRIRQNKLASTKSELETVLDPRCAPVAEDVIPMGLTGKRPRRWGYQAGRSSLRASLLHAISSSWGARRDAR